MVIPEQMKAEFLECAHDKGATTENETDETWEWERYLPLVLYAYRTTTHTSTKVTPFQLMYGRDSCITSDLEVGTSHDPTSYEIFLCEKLAKLRDFVEGDAAREQCRQKEYYDREAHFSTLSKFNTGDSVLLSIPQRGVDRKLRDRWEGGWTISKVEGPVDIQIRHLDGRTKVTHINRLQHHVQRNDQERFSSSAEFEG